MKKKLLNLSVASIFASVAFGQTKPIASYPFTGNANSEIIAINGTVNGAVLTEDRFGNANKAYKFDGINDYISLTNSTSYAFTNTFTISAWVNFKGKSTATVDGSGIIISREGEYELGVDSTGVLMWALSTSTVTGWTWNKTSATLTRNKWHQVVYQFGASTVKVFVDGVMIDQKAFTGTIDEADATTNNQDDFRIGGREAFTQYFNGSIDLVNIYNVALPANEIADKYAKENRNPEHFAVASYPFSGDAKDAIGSIDGVVQGPILQPDRFGAVNSAYLFDGSNDYIDLGDTNAFEFSRSFSVSAWVKQTGPSTGGDQSGIIINREGEYELGVSGSGVLQFAVSTSTIASWQWYVTTAKLTLNKWHHLVFMYEAGFVKLYLDGVFAGSQNLGGVLDEAGTATSAQDNLQIGGRQGYPAEQNFKGGIDDITIYNYSLSAAEVKSLYDKELVTNVTNEIFQTSETSIYPNPSKGTFRINTSKEISKVDLVSLDGKQSAINYSNEEVSLQNHEAGLYFLKINFVDGTSSVQRISVVE